MSIVKIIPKVTPKPEVMGGDIVVYDEGSAEKVVIVGVVFIEDGDRKIAWSNNIVTSYNINFAKLFTGTLEVS